MPAAPSLLNRPNPKNKFVARFFHDAENNVVLVKAKNKWREFKLRLPATQEILNDMRGHTFAWFKIEMQQIEGTTDSNMLIRGRTHARDWTNKKGTGF